MERTQHTCAQYTERLRWVMQSKKSESGERPEISARVIAWLTVTAALAGGIGALATWYYQYLVLPSRAPQHVNISAHITPIGEENGVLALRVDVSIANRSGRTVYVPEAAMLLEGHGTQPATWTREDYLKEANLHLRKQPGAEITSSYARKVSSSDVLGFGGFAGGWKLEPDESTSQRQVMYVDPSGYDFISLTVEAVETGHEHGRGFFQLAPPSNDQREITLVPSQSDKDQHLPNGYQLTESVTVLSLWPPLSRSAPRVGPAVSKGSPIK